MSFEVVAKRWSDTTQHALKESSVVRRETCINNLLPFFKGATIRNITTRHCERWVTERGPDIAPQTFAHELAATKAVFDYAVRLGLVLTNPARDIKRRKIIRTEIRVSSRDEFQKLLTAIRFSDGRATSQAKARAGADLVELLAYSGCRLTSL